MSGTEERMTAARRAANEIAHGKAPDWMVTALADLSVRVAGFRESDESLPQRAAILARLDKLGRAMRLGARELGRHDMRVFIDNADEQRVTPYLETLPEVLFEISRRAEIAASAIPRGQGNAPALPQHHGGPSRGIPARTLAAFIVHELWFQHHKCYAAVSNDRAHAACDALWEAAGGTPDPGVSWRGWMVKARAGSTLTTFKGDLDDIRNSLRTRAMLAKP